MIAQDFEKLFCEDPPIADYHDDRSVLGSGKFGTTHRMINTADNRKYAVKRMKLAIATKGGATSAMLLQECTILEQLSHPNIVQYVLNFFSMENRYFNIVMELIEGGTLEDKILCSPAPTEAEIVEWARQMASALSYMHGKGILHRSLKPNHMMLISESTIKIIGFGKACLSYLPVPRVEMVGDVTYSSYEKLNGIPYDGRDDVWAVGCILLELLTKARLLHAIANPEGPVAVERAQLLASAAATSPQLGGQVLPHLLSPLQASRFTAEQVDELVRANFDAHAGFHKDLPPPDDKCCVDIEEIVFNEVCKYSFEIAPGTGQQTAAPAAVQVYVPLHSAQEDIPGGVYYADNPWKDSQRRWESTARGLEDALASMPEKDLARCMRAEQSVRSEEATLTATLARIQADTTTIKRADALAQQELSLILARQGARHVERDADSDPTSSFPNGDSLVAEFRAAWADFSSFAVDAVDGLREYDPDGNVTKVFVHNVMLPIHHATLAYVERAMETKQWRMVSFFGPAAQTGRRDSDDVAWQFFLYTQQRKLPGEITALSEGVVQGIISKADARNTSETNEARRIVALTQDLLQEGVKRGTFAQLLSLADVVRHFLRLHTLALLSDPRCYLLPAPGTRLPYREGHCEEVLSPGVRKYGRIQEGDTVEVVLPGLYFEEPGEAGAVPRVPMKVRRLGSSDGFSQPSPKPAPVPASVPAPAPPTPLPPPERPDWWNDPVLPDSDAVPAPEPQPDWANDPVLFEP